MRFIIYGEDSYRSSKQLAALRRRFRETRDTSGLNERQFTAPREGVEDAAEAIFASPFLADRKLVVLNGYLKLPKAEQRRLAEMLAGKPDSTVAVFYENEASAELKDSPLFDILSGEKFSEEFAALQGTQILDFIVTECTSHGMSIDVTACRNLAELVGGDSWALHQETAKLCALARSRGTEMVTADLVREVSCGDREESAFVFLDACMQGRPRDSLALLQRLLASGMNHLQVLSMLQKQLKNIIGAQDLAERGIMDRNEIGRRLGIHPFPAGKALAIARNAPSARLRGLLVELVETESRFKTGAGLIRTEMDVFAMKMAGK